MYDDIFKEIIHSMTSFDDFCDRLNRVHTNKVRGTYFEWFAKLLLLHDPRYSNFVKKCWLLEELSFNTLKRLKIPDNDIGIDIVVKTHNGEYFAVQVKYRKHIECCINWESLSTFFGLAFGLTNKFKKGILFTNTIKPNKYVENQQNMIYILNHSLKDITENTFIKIKNVVLETNISEKITKSPRQYQIEIIEKAIEYYKENDKGRLYMPCGTGKTLVCRWIADKLTDKKRICIVVPSLYLLSQMYSDWVEDKKCNYLLVGSDAEIKTQDDIGLLLTTNSDDINTYLTEHVDDTVVIITTYQSSDVFANVCQKSEFELDLIIFDEAHKTVGSDDRIFSCLLSDDNITTKKRLFTTATEKVYKGENEDILSMDDTEKYGDVIYSYSFKKAIENGQLCDYQVIAPLINDDGFWKVVKDNKYVIDKTIREKEIESRYYMTAYLLCRNIKEKGLTHILTFNNINDNAKMLCEILRKMLEQMNIDCNCYHLTGDSSMKERRRVVDQFVKDKCAIISSARIFQEGINIPIVDCVCFVDNKLSVIDIIQSVGRVLRLYEGKKMGYIIIPTLINIEESDDNIFDIDPNDFGLVKNILKALGTVDKRLIDEFITKDNKAFSGSNRKFITEPPPNIEWDSNLKISIDDLVDKIGTIICDRWGEVNWFQNLDAVKKYITENGKRPNNDGGKGNLGRWIGTQQRKYGTKTECMKNEEIYDRWTEFIHDYKDYLQNGEEKWFKTLNAVKKYMNENNILPFRTSENIEEKKLGAWISTAKANYKNKTQCMKNKEIYDKWTNFIEKYNEFFKTNEESWVEKLDCVKKYIDENCKRPSQTDKNNEIKVLGRWITTNIKKHKAKKECMENKKIYSKWSLFIEEYKEYFKENEESWFEKLDCVKKYIDLNHKLPSTNDKNQEIKSLCMWISNQKNSYKKKEECMKKIKIYEAWSNFTEEYNEYFITYDELWFENLDKCKKYIDLKHKLPSTIDKNQEVSLLRRFINRQINKFNKKSNCIKNKEMCDMWTEFITEYNEYFKTNEKKWVENLDKCKKYIDLNHKLPSTIDKKQEVIRLGRFIDGNCRSYKNKNKCMKNNKIHDKWIDFVEKYDKYFKTNKEKWFEIFNKVKIYIDKNEKRPPCHSKNKEIQYLSKWISHQQSNYRTKSKCMKNEEIYNQWTEFTNEFNVYFKTNEEQWFESLEKVRKYIDENKKRPSNSDKNKNIKSLAQWIGDQQKNYKNRINIMKNEAIHDKWTEFIGEYKEYF